MQNRGWTVLAVVLAITAGAPRALEAQAPPTRMTFTLEDAYRLAAERNGMVRAAHAMADAVAARESAAGLLPDPMLQLGIMNASLPGLRTDMPNSMAPAIQAMQMVPFFGKLGLSARVAEQSTAIARAEADESVWEIRTRTAMAFYDIYEADRQLEVMRETLRLLKDFEQVAKAMYAAGEGRQSDVLRAGVEVSRMDADIRRMAAMRQSAAARLNGLLDRPADTDFGAPVLLPLPLEIAPLDTLRGWAAQFRPLLSRGRSGVERARARTDLAHREIWPDPVFGIQYGQRSGEHMGSVMVGFTLPVFAGRRQLRMRDEARAMEAAAQAELADARASVDARLIELGAELERTRALLDLYRAEVLPQARANVQSAFSSYRVGRVDFLTLVDAQMMVYRYEQERYGLMAEYGRFIAELEMTVGRVLPASALTLVEDA